MRPLVEFCVSNLANGAQKALEQLERDPNIDVLEYGCLGYCGICAQTLFAVVEGEPIKGETPDELVKNIYSFLEENMLI
ncbi:YuzB family protein [Bacillus sp. RG28]|jgi:uncharacterized protein YuzB (UPF0349 family)|uniref:UPF0349 protein J5Y03_10550 n=1 Tax=Gottfriedia endophytica TaxID=2820819 RepID=A0A940NNW0_9BACI|nr:YuzB family protein [Gottfriedia endophytica]MBP0725609.1 YuzB family protein [Gottfriedia endophytica]